MGATMKRKQWRFIVMGILFWGACAGSSPPPPTETGPEFPAERYLTATGIGETEAEARRAAVAEMSQIFESKVLAETFASAQSIIGESNQESFTKEVESSVRMVSAVELKGVRIGKTWKAESGGPYYALAVLDKLQARRSWDGEIETLETAMEGTKSALAAAHSDFRKLQAQNQMMTLWLQRESIRSRLRVIGFAGMREDEDDIRKIAKTAAEIRERLKIFIAVDGEKGDVVENVLGRRLTENGYNLVLNETEADILLQGDLRLENVNLQNPQVRFVRAMVHLRLLDRAENREMGDVTEDVRKGHVDRSEAARNAVESVAEMAADKMIAFFGEADKPRE